MEAIIDAYLDVEQAIIFSKNLKRNVVVDFFLPKMRENGPTMSLLLINDGQDMPTMNFGGLLNRLYHEQKISPLLCAAISTCEDRRMEYGVVGEPDFKGRGAKAGKYQAFVLKELLPFIRKKFKITRFRETSFAGFSLGGLSALDISWNHPRVFTKVGIFSGSLWWRSKNQEDPDYDDHQHRIMQQQIRNGKTSKKQKFFFQCGALDELEDRNHNGIVDAIDDTLDTIHELINAGCPLGSINYLELKDGRHNVPTWGRAMPIFLEWGWGTHQAKKNR